MAKTSSKSKRESLDALFVRDISTDTSLMSDDVKGKKELMDKLDKIIRDEYADLGIAAITDKGSRSALKEKLQQNYSKIYGGDPVILDELLEETVGFGVIERMIRNPEVTDITFNGTELVVETNGDKRINETHGLVDSQYIDRLATKYASALGSGKDFMQDKPILDAVVGNMRVNFVHESSAQAGTTMAIRVSHTKLVVTRSSIALMAPAYVGELLLGFVSAQANIVMSGRTGTGKALTNSTKIPTPNGWKLNGDLKVGDFVFDRHGNPTKVIGVYPQGLKRAFRVVFSDGRSIVCNDEHLWSYYDSQGLNYNTLKTAKLKDLISKGITSDRQIFGHKSTVNNFKIPMNEPVDFEIDSKLPVDPYVFGAMLGNGNFTAPSLTFTSNDVETVDKLKHLLRSKEAVKSGDYNWHFRLPDGKYKNGQLNYKTSDLFSDFPDLIATADHKYIPDIYKTSSVADRWSIIQGLFDTDGFISNSSNRFPVRYASVSVKLLEDIQEILLSLGVQSTISLQESASESNIRVNDLYVLRVLCDNDIKSKFFTLSRKLNLALEATTFKKHRLFDRVAIRNVVDLGYDVEMTCIEVDNDEHLYLAGDYIVTHNTEQIKLYC